MPTLHEKLITANLPVLGQAEEGVTVCWTRPLNEQEADVAESIINPAVYRRDHARVAANNIPNWATWTEAQVLAWFAANIDTPLAAPIPANPMSVQQIRGTLVALVAIIDAQNTAQKAMARMIVALRDHTRIIE